MLENNTDPPIPSVSTITGLLKRYETPGLLAIDGLGLIVHSGDLLTVVSPSACGKSTLLRARTGLLQPTNGEVRVHGGLVRGRPSKDVGLVFQDYARSLLPWLTERSSVELPLKYRDVTARKRRVAADEALASVSLGDAADRHPGQLLGGRQQRARIARALACRPARLLMHEPFASVDAHTRIELEDLVLRVWEDSDITIVIITREIDESVYRRDRLVVLDTSPTSVRTTLDVPLPRPRDPITSKERTEFAHLRSTVLNEMRAARVSA